MFIVEKSFQDFSVFQWVTVSKNALTYDSCRLGIPTTAFTFDSWLVGFAELIESCYTLGDGILL